MDRTTHGFQDTLLLYELPLGKLGTLCTIFVTSCDPILTSNFKN